VLHLIQHGLFTYLSDAIVDQKAILTRKRSRATAFSSVRAGQTFLNSSSTSDADSDLSSSDSSVDESSTIQDGCPNDDSNLSDEFHQQLFGKGCVLESFLIGDELTLSDTRKVFTDQRKAEINRLTRMYGRMLCHQSDREFNRSYFAEGITSKAKKEGHEERCVLLHYLIILCSVHGNQFEKHISNQRCSLFVMVISHSLLLEHFLRSASLTKKQVDAFQKYIPLFLSVYKECVSRITGNGMKIIKFHLPLHSPADIYRFGPPTCTDASPGETHHKEYKQYGERSSKNSDTFERQIALQDSSTAVLHRAEQELYPGKHNIVFKDDDTGATLASSITDIPASVSWYANLSGIFNVKSKKDEPPVPCSWVHPLMRQHIHNFLVSDLFPFIGEEKVYLKTFAKVGGFLYRADPSKVTNYNRGWHDWVNVHWNDADGGPMPARILTFVEVKTVLNASTHINHPGLYAVIASVTESLYSTPSDSSIGDNFRAHQATRLLYYSKVIPGKEYTATPHLPKCVMPLLYIVRVNENSFLGPVIAVPYNIDECLSDNEWLFIEPTCNWASIYDLCMNDLMQTNN
jgi:hypothetical protein